MEAVPGEPRALACIACSQVLATHRHKLCRGRSNGPSTKQTMFQEASGSCCHLELLAAMNRERNGTQRVLRCNKRNTCSNSGTNYTKPASPSARMPDKRSNIFRKLLPEAAKRCSGNKERRNSRESSRTARGRRASAPLACFERLDGWRRTDRSHSRRSRPGSASI